MWPEYDSQSPPEMIMSHLGHTTRFIQSFQITETFEVSSVFNMPTDKLLYDDRHWQKILEKDIRKISLERKLHLIFTLVISLQISVAQLLHFIFTSDIKEVRGRAQGSWDTRPQQPQRRWSSRLEWYLAHGITTSRR